MRIKVKIGAIALRVLFLLLGATLVGQLMPAGRAQAASDLTNLIIFLTNDPSPGETKVVVTRNQTWKLNDGSDLTEVELTYLEDPSQYYFNPYPLVSNNTNTACLTGDQRNIVSVVVTTSEGSVTKSNWNVCTAARDPSDGAAATTTIDVSANAVPSSFQLQLDYAFQNDISNLGSLAVSSLQEFTLEGSAGSFSLGDSDINVTKTGIVVNNIPKGTYNLSLLIKPVPEVCNDAGSSSYGSILCTNSREAATQSFDAQYTFADQALVIDSIQLDLGSLASDVYTNPTEEAADQNEKPATCESSTGGALGWIMCAGVRLVVNVVSFFTGLIEYFLKVSPVVATDTQGKATPLYLGWAAMKNISLVLLVIAALFAVFGQSLGIEAYTVKKMLPRVIIAAISVLLSFSIVAILVDIFNVLGSGIQDLLLSNFADQGVGIKVDFASFILTTIGTLTGLGLAGGAGILWLAGAGFAGGGTVVIFILIPLVLGVLGAVFTLIFRQILIIMLVIIAPVAFIAWTLPNTEKFFKLWLNTLIKALAMYPIIMLLIVSGQIFAGIITSADDANPVNLMIGLVAVAIPLFLVPFTFKYAGSAIAGVNAGIKNLSAKGSEAIKGDKQDPDSQRNRLRDHRIENRSQFGSGKGRLARLSRSKALGNIQGLGSTNRRQILAEAQGLNNAKQMMEQIANSPNSKALDAMIYDGHAGPPIVTGFNDHGDPIYGEAPMASAADQATAKRLLKDPYMKAEAYALAMEKQAGSEETLRHTLARGRALGITTRENASAMKRPQRGKMGIGTVDTGASERAGRVVYGWESAAGGNTLDRQAAAHKLMVKESDISSYEMSQHKAISFEAMSNFVTSGADTEFGYDESGVMQSRIDKIRQVAYGAFTERNEDGEIVGTSQAPPDTQAAALKALENMQASVHDKYDFSPPPLRTDAGGGRGGGGGSATAGPATPRIIRPGDSDYTPPSPSDLPKGRS